jgi:hypothetical protein
MASLIENFINVQITLLTSFIPRTGFGTPLFIGETLPTGTPITGGTYSQTTTTVTVTKTAHGLSVGQEISVDALTGTAVDGEYVVATVPTANTFTYTAGTSLTTTGNITFAPVIRVGSYASLEEVAVVYDTTDPEYLASQAYFSQGDVNPLMIGYKKSSESYSQALTAIRAIRDDFYAIAIQNDDLSVQTAFGTTVLGLAGEKIAFYRTSDANTLNAGNSTDIASVLKAVDNDYVHVTYHYNTYSGTNITGLFPEMAYMGVILAITETPTFSAGSFAWHNQKVVGITSSFNPVGGKRAFTQTERNTLNTKNADAFESDGANVRSLGGKMAGGEWGDVIHGTAWLKTRLGEDFYQLLATKADLQQKVTFDVNGLAEVEQTLRNRLNLAVDSNFIDSNYTVSVPKLQDTLAEDRANRTLKDVKFTARLTGAVKFIEVRGIVTV